MMKLITMLFSIALIPAYFIGCSEDADQEGLNECPMDIDTIDFSFAMEYNKPEMYLVPGEQSDLEDLYLDDVRNATGVPRVNIEDVLKICHWVNQNFTFENAGGAMAGVNHVNELFKIRTFYGCHSQALIISSILRGFGFPAIMVETADVNWAYDYNKGIAQHFSGHVMSEVFVEDGWILLDNNGRYVKDYDPYNPFIPVVGHPTDAYFVFAKGTDIWDYSGNVDSFTHEHLVFFAENIYCYEKLFNTVEYTWDN